MYTYEQGTGPAVVAHANHNWEEWRGYVNDISGAPEWVTGASSGLCCHDCSVVLVDAR